MIYSLNGIVTEKLNDRVIITCGGVGFNVQMTRHGISSVAPVGETALVFIHMAVREDSMDLYGFADSDERDCFRLLLGVSGVGPKVALAVLSGLVPSELAAAVATGDCFRLLLGVSGVGPKVAQRIVLELKDKLGAMSSVPVKQTVTKQGDASKTIEAIDALMTLGYTQHEAKRAVSNMDISDMSVEDIIRVALKEMM